MQQPDTDASDDPVVRTGKVVESPFRPARWLANAHLQTMFPSLPWPVGPQPKLTRELLNLPDGDVTVVDKLTATEDPDAPLLVLLHGLESSSESSYARHLRLAAHRSTHAPHHTAKHHTKTRTPRPSRIHT